jgi:hypothetical protein
MIYSGGGPFRIIKIAPNIISCGEKNSAVDFCRGNVTPRSCAHEAGQANKHSTFRVRRAVVWNHLRRL